MNLHRAILLLLFALLALPCQAADFRAGQVEGLLDLTLAYGLGVRLDDADKDLVAIANGGKVEGTHPVTFGLMIAAMPPDEDVS